MKGSWEGEDREEGDKVMGRGRSGVSGVSGVGGVGIGMGRERKDGT